MMIVIIIKLIFLLPLIAIGFHISEGRPRNIIIIIVILMFYQYYYIHPTEWSSGRQRWRQWWRRTINSYFIVKLNTLLWYRVRIVSKPVREISHQLRK